MLAVELVMLVLACNQIVETIRHGSIFSSSRAWIEARQDWLSELVACGFCFSHWAAGGVVAWWALGWLLVALVPFQDQNDMEPFRLVWNGPVLALAVSRGAQLLNDLTKPYNRTPNSIHNVSSPLPLEEDQ